jgi:hypothetical protein
MKKFLKNNPFSLKRTATQADTITIQNEELATAPADSK